MKTSVILWTSIFLALLISLGSSCDPEEAPKAISIYSLTNAPPGHEIDFIEDDDGNLEKIVLSKGVVVAIRCWDNCDYQCVSPTFVLGDEGILQVHPVSV